MKSPAKQAHALLPKDQWKQLTKDNQFADLARQQTPSHFLDFGLGMQTRRSVNNRFKGNSQNMNELDEKTPTPESNIKGRKQLSALKFGKNQMISEIQPMSSEYRNRGQVQRNITHQRSLSDIRLMVGNKQESEMSRLNFSFKDNQKNLNLKNETSIGIPLPFNRNFGNVHQ